MVTPDLKPGDFVRKRGTSLGGQVVFGGASKTLVCNCYGTDRYYDTPDLVSAAPSEVGFPESGDA